MLLSSLRRLPPAPPLHLLARSWRASSSAAGGDTPQPSPPPPPADAAPSSLFAASLASLAAAPAPPHPVRSVLAADHGVGDFIRDLVRGVRARAAVALTRQHLETDFNEAEFCEGAKDAFFMVNAAIGAGDVRALRPAVSPTLLAGFKDVKAAYDGAGLSLSLDVDPATLGAAIDDMGLMNGAAVASAGGAVEAGEGEEGDETPASVAAAFPGGGGGGAAAHHLAGLYQILAVRFTGAVNVAVRRGGDLLATSVDRRPKTWRFVRGPLPAALPARQLEAPWTLLAID